MMEPPEDASSSAKAGVMLDMPQGDRTLMEVQASAGGARMTIRTQDSSQAHCTWCWRNFPGTPQSPFKWVASRSRHLLQGRGHMATNLLQMERNGCFSAKTRLSALGLLATSWGEHAQPPRPHSSHVLDGCGDSQLTASMQSWQCENHLQFCWRILVVIK